MVFFYARAERFELPSTVLETAILPLNYARRKLKAISGWLIALSDDILQIYKSFAKPGG
jgi:hypothetical protein